MTALCLKNKGLKSKASSLSKELEISKSKDEQYRLNKQILKRENELLQVQINEFLARLKKKKKTELQISMRLDVREQ